jgi:hypothetical protein
VKVSRTELNVVKLTEPDFPIHFAVDRRSRGRAALIARDHMEKLHAACCHSRQENLSRRHRFAQAAVLNRAVNNEMMITRTAQ